jgi:hypothetical protein
MKEKSPKSIDVRPEFFTSEKLQDLETAYPGKYTMFVFMALRSLSNAQGKFPLDRELIKKYILPKLCDAEESLDILIKKGFIKIVDDDNAMLIDDDKLTRLTPHICYREDETPGYSEWRRAVLERDLYICQNCGDTYKLRVHHIKPYKACPESRIDINNGITLCEKCHKKEHSRHREGKNV